MNLTCTRDNVTQADLTSQVKRALRVSSPLIAIETADPGATQAMLSIGLNGHRPKVAWDIVRGLYGLNDQGRQVITELGPNEAEATKNNPVKALVLAASFPADTLLWMHNAHKFLSQPAPLQAVWNLRDINKTDGRCLLMLVPIGTDLPIEIRSDVMVFADPLPNDFQLRQIIIDQIESVEHEEGFVLSECREQIDQASATLRGTNAFQAEQLAAMSIQENGFAQEYLRTQARKLIEQTKGLQFERGSETFDEVRGLQGVMDWATDVFNGPAAPTVIVRIEELEKAMAGVHGDLSGTSQDTHQVLLSAMEDEGWDGAICYGVPGAGKSLMAKSMANTHGARGLRLDINACKGSLVGQSEAQIRQAIEIIKTIGGSRVLFLASCNRLETIPPELLRRFRSGVWFFNTPNAEARREIWALHCEQFGVPYNDMQIGAVDEDDLTGADIRNIVEQAWKRNKSITEARRWVVALKQRSPEVLEEARRKAMDRFWDVSTGEVYTRAASQGKGRRTRLARATESKD